MLTKLAVSYSASGTSESCDQRSRVAHRDVATLWKQRTALESAFDLRWKTDPMSWRFLEFSRGPHQRCAPQQKRLTAAKLKVAVIIDNEFTVRLFILKLLPRLIKISESAACPKARGVVVKTIATLRQVDKIPESEDGSNLPPSKASDPTALAASSPVLYKKAGGNHIPEAAHPATRSEEHLDGGLNAAAGTNCGGNAWQSVISTSIEAEIRGGANVPHPQLTISARTTQANLALRQAIAEGTCSPDVLLALLSELPPKDDIAPLLDIFFRDINPVRLPPPENDIRRAFELNTFIWGPPREDGATRATHIFFLPLLFMIIATASFCLPLPLSKRIDVRTQPKRIVHTAAPPRSPRSSHRPKLSSAHTSSPPAFSSSFTPPPTVGPSSAQCSA
ncbi:translational elongation factor EF-1 alpha [Ceratobasidium sp. 394]|nr:translational elongation factor EF-1 alpha [Ceratobasidium sp. 394]